MKVLVDILFAWVLATPAIFTLVYLIAATTGAMATLSLEPFNLLEWEGASRGGLSMLSLFGGLLVAIRSVD